MLGDALYIQFRADWYYVLEIKQEVIKFLKP